MTTLVQFKDFYNNNPRLLIEGYEHLTNKQQQSIDETYRAFIELSEALNNEFINGELIEEGWLDNIKAKAAGAVASIKQTGTNIVGGEGSGKDAGTAGSQAQIKSLLDSLKKNVGTLTAKFKQDAIKTLGKDSPVLASITNIEQGLNKAGIEAKDNGLATKAIGLLGKIIGPITKKINDLYEKSGPIKDFDNKYQALLTKIQKKYPKIAEPMKKFSELAKQNKGKATFIIGALTAAITASGATGPFAPVVFGVLMRGLYGMLSGEPPAKSFGKAAITAAAGKLAGAAVRGLFDDIGHAVGVGGHDAVGDAAHDAAHDAASNTEGAVDSSGMNDLSGMNASPEAMQAWQESEYIKTTIGASPKYVENVINDPELHNMVVSGNTIDLNKLNGIMKFASEHQVDGHLPSVEEIKAALNQGQ